MPVSLLLAPMGPLIWRMAATAIAVGLAWNPLRGIIYGRGAHAVRRIEWSPEGHWTLTDAAGQRWPARLAPSSANWGLWLLLVWDIPGRRLWTLIEAASAGPRAFRTLKGRLNC